MTLSRRQLIDRDDNPLEDAGGPDRADLERREQGPGALTGASRSEAEGALRGGGAGGLTPLTALSKLTQDTE